MVADDDDEEYSIFERINKEPPK